MEREYVLIEKRAVEVNALADELANSPQLHTGFRASSAPQHGAMVRRATTAGTNPPTSTHVQSRAIQIAPGKPRPDPLHQRTGSYERRYGPTPSSATSAISKALNMANFRLFGMSPPAGTRLSPPQGYGAFPTYPTAQPGMLVIGDGTPTEHKDEDMKIVMHAEELAHRSDVVYGFAEVKYKQLLPAPPSNDHGLSIGQSSEDDGDNDLTTDAVVAISEEALVLYVKALAILAKAIDLAGSWWGHKNRGEIIAEAQRSHSPRGTPATVGTRMNNVVQWVRGRFNECVEKSEFVGRKLVDAQKNLPYDHPGHPSNHAADSGSATSIGTSAENITLTSGVTAEKL
ncbi:hypothetical protein LTS18_015153, partial [Coniosporium uncinatum]